MRIYSRVIKVVIVGAIVSVIDINRVMANADDLKLELVQVLFRHGARTCSQSEALLAIPDYVDQELHDKYGYEQLTNIGKAQAHDLGCALRKRYNDYLGPHYKPQEVYAYSSNTDRTKMSLQLVLAGLYPPAEHQSWHPELNWHPIPTHYLPKELDILLQTFHNPRYQKILAEARNSSVFDDRKKDLTEINNRFFAKHKIESLSNYGYIGLMGIFNVLNSHKAANAQLPHWYTDELFDTLKEQVMSYFDGMVLTTEMKKLSTGPLIKTVLENMNAIDESKKNPRKIYLYSGHELNIAAFTRAHDIKEFRYPDFANALVIEKFRDSKNQVYIRMLYRTGKDSEFQPITLGNFTEYCPLEEYLKIIENVLPSDEEVNALFENLNIDFKQLCCDNVTKRTENTTIP